MGRSEHFVSPRNEGVQACRDISSDRSLAATVVVDEQSFAGSGLLHPPQPSPAQPCASRSSARSTAITTYSLSPHSPLTISGSDRQVTMAAPCGMTELRGITLKFGYTGISEGRVELQRDPWAPPPPPLALRCLARLSILSSP